ncbi:MAG TPA: ABC transporter ATP-binding protein [Gemmatimonadaceae bacterium]|nr:ABC transporter ATP-binding protein [Gemmatimonadaceae bacterium]
MIRFEDLVVRYPRAKAPALAGVSIDADRGKVTAVVGPNGSGKTTLVRTLLRLQAPSAGRVLIDGEPLLVLDRVAVARRVAVVTQREEIVFPLPVRQYVALGRYPHEGPWRAESSADREAVERALSLADVLDFADRRSDELSGGEWQRVRIARALAQQGDALVLDEPTTFLDVAHEMAMFELLAALAARGMAVLIVSHQLNLVARFAQALVLLSRGSVAASGTPDHVMRAETLERVYQWPLVVTRDPAVGAPALLPLRRTPRA